MEQVIGRGRPISIPESARGLVFQLHERGYGFRRIADMLAEQGVYTTRGSIFRLLHGLPPYEDIRFS